MVFGISVAALPELFPDALADPHNEPLQWMVRALATTQTQAAQLWFAPRPEAPHWPGRLPLAAPIAIPYQMPFDTVADMEHILLHERWTQPVSRLFYLCAALPDDELPPPRGDLEYPARQRARVHGNIASWLERLGAPLLRDAEGTLFEASNQSQRSWLEQQYVNAPVNPSDRYVLCTPGSAAYRLGADQSGYENLYLTGDWIRTAVSAGCLEAATMAGVQAARAIDPAVPKALGDWLPEPAPQVRSGGNDHALVYRDGDLVGQPPIAIPRLDLFVFVLRADERALQRLCAAQLELGGPTTYRPLGPFVMLYASSMTNEARPFGRCDELDIGFWIPLIASGDEHVVMYSPYVWVDNSLALASGRELFGFPKQLGTLSFAPSEGRFAVSTSVLPRRGGDVELRPLIEVRTNGAPRAAASLGSWGELAAAGARLAARLIGRHPSAMQHWMTQMVTRPSLPMMFLKQLPGASNERRAVYRALIEASIDVAPGPYSLTPLDGPVEVTLYEYESHRIARTLGLLRRAHHAGISQLRPEAQARLRFGAVVQPGIEVWRDV